MTQVTTESKPSALTPDMFVAVLASKIRNTLHDGGPTVESVLLWIKGHDPSIIKAALLRTQPKGWEVAFEPYVESQTEEQRVALLAALVAVFAQVM